MFYKKRHNSSIQVPRKTAALLDLALKVLTLHQIGDIILVVVLLLALGLLHVLVGLGQLAEGGEGVRAQLVEDAGDELGEFLLLAVAVEGEGVGGDGGVDCEGEVVSGRSSPGRGGIWLWMDGLEREAGQA